MRQVFQMECFCQFSNLRQVVHSHVHFNNIRGPRINFNIHFHLLNTDIYRIITSHPKLVNVQPSNDAIYSVLCFKLVMLMMIAMRVKKKDCIFLKINKMTIFILKVCLNFTLFCMNFILSVAYQKSSNLIFSSS